MVSSTSSCCKFWRKLLRGLSARVQLTPCPRWSLGVFDAHTMLRRLLRFKIVSSGKPRFVWALRLAGSAWLAMLRSKLLLASLRAVRIDGPRPHQMACSCAMPLSYPQPLYRIAAGSEARCASIDPLGRERDGDANGGRPLRSLP
ncbi:uncharacterized protein LAESUDRAFT_152945 [Laetiporus sulphureus 93-53]|uniref:Uncharacterized protein n=1 Tax=Laetiporus sulphureus 93-53 TaxID=1314785 RepID=A0A165HJ65_9APHY|nr:uncharacterized protein LAESUDRAFT_152945 [Laetiporus sulphureus 93-53]KZT11796.1 hypothetical protein LAESUDRAFT_152945 [Laetiporus sulphureus 93-53]